MQYSDKGNLEVASGMGMCDFCSPPSGPSVWIYPCESFTFPVQLRVPQYGNRTQFSDGDWSACETCAQLIEKGHKEKLARRCPRLHKIGIQQATVNAFFEHRIDKPRYTPDGVQPFVVFDETVVFPD